jgi:hypothetical protein
MNPHPSVVYVALFEVPHSGYADELDGQCVLVPSTYTMRKTSASTLALYGQSSVADGMSTTTYVVRLLQSTFCMWAKWVVQLGHSAGWMPVRPTRTFFVSLLK